MGIEEKKVGQVMDNLQKLKSFHNKVGEEIHEDHRNIQDCVAKKPIGKLNPELKIRFDNNFDARNQISSKNENSIKVDHALQRQNSQPILRKEKCFINITESTNGSSARPYSLHACNFFHEKENNLETNAKSFIKSDININSTNHHEKSTITDVENLHHPTHTSSVQQPVQDPKQAAATESIGQKQDEEINNSQHKCENKHQTSTNIPPIPPPRNLPIQNDREVTSSVQQSIKENARNQHGEIYPQVASNIAPIPPIAPPQNLQSVQQQQDLEINTLFQKSNERPISSSEQRVPLSDFQTRSNLLSEIHKGIKLKPALTRKISNKIKPKETLSNIIRNKIAERREHLNALQDDNYPSSPECGSPRI